MKILVAGDYSPKFRLEKLLENKDYSAIFGEVEPFIQRADLSIVNFESVIRHPNQNTITKLGSCLSCNENAIDALRWAGFNVITLANNHSMDYGSNGLEITLDTAHKAGIRTVGAGMNLDEAKRILYHSKDDFTIGIINCCEHEFSIADQNEAGANPLDLISQYESIQDAKEKADYIIVIVHGGHEHFQLPSLRMQDTYRHFINLGADAVINHHQHCFSGYEMYKGKPIFYGLGNFCFDEKTHVNPTLWIEGYMVELDIQQDNTSFKLIPYIQCSDEPKISLLNDKSSFYQRIQELNKTITIREKLIENLDNYYSAHQKAILSVVEPYVSRLGKSLYFRGILPDLINQKKALTLLNKINCESHLDKLQFVLRKLVFK